MSETIRVYDCGCCHTPETLELCRKAKRLEDRMHDAELDAQSFMSSAWLMTRYPLTYDDPEYFERHHSLKEQAKKLAGTAELVEELSKKEVRALHQASRAHRAISHHVARQSKQGLYRDEFVEPPPEDDFDPADLY